MTKKSPEQSQEQPTKPLKEEMPEGIREAYEKAVRKKLDGNEKGPEKPETGITSDSAPELPEGWTIEKDTNESVPSVDVEKFFEEQAELVPPTGKETIEQALKNFDANLGLNTAKWLEKNQEKIPSNLRGNYLFFPGTEVCGSLGDRRVPYLGWDGGRWYLDFGRLAVIHGFFDRLVRSRATS